MKITRLNKIMLVLAGMGLLGYSAFAQKQAPPEGSAPKAFTVPASEIFTLPNGMKVTLVPYGIIPKAAISISVDAGELNEGKGHAGVSSLIAELFKEGTATLDSQKLGVETARMGSALSVSANDDQTDFSLDVLQEFAPDGVRLLADVLQHPRFPESEVARLKTDMLRTIALQASQPQTIAEMRFRKILYGDHPYGTVLPSEEDVKKLTLLDVKDFYAANFGAQRSHIYVAGQIRPGSG